MTAWRRREPTRTFINAADNDVGKLRSAGAEIASKLHRQIGAIPVLPTFGSSESGKDWNDFAQLHGLARMRDAMREALRQRSAR